MIKINTLIGTLGVTLGFSISAFATDINSNNTLSITTALGTKDKISAQAEMLQTRGVLKARQTANLAAGMSARILKAPYKPGQRFKRGALLVRFDCERLNAEKSAVNATKSAAEFKHTNIKELLFAGAAGELEATLAAAEVRRADAELGVIKAKLKDCNIYAPYNGIVQEKHISVFDTPALNAPLLSIVRDGAPEIKLIAPSSWMAWIKSGSTFEFTIDETGKTFPAKVLRTGASVDPVSQTIELTAKFTKPASGAMAGMSGVASFPSEFGK